ncbi:hypothetical protein GCM10027425_26050 [Alteromonas gracilis]
MIKKTIAAGSLALASAGLVGLAGPAHADDVEQRTGSCSQGAKHVMVLRDAGDDPDRLATSFRINGDRPGAFWKFTVQRGGKTVYTESKRANRFGDVRTARVFRGDDDSWVRVVATSGYGERCARALKLDD